MTAAMRRLEDLLQNPGTRIAIKPAGRSDPREDDESSHWPSGDGPNRSLDISNDAAPLFPANAPQHSLGMPAETVWAKRLGTGPDAPPLRIAKPVGSTELPKGVRPGVKKPASAAAGGIFDVFLSWLSIPRDGEVREAIAASRRALIATLLISAVINILMMAGPLSMMLVYDHVLSSGSVSTLITLTAITACLFGIVGMLDLARSRIMGRVGADIDQRLSNRIFDSAMRKSLTSQGSARTALRDLDTLRQFLSGPAPIVLFDTLCTPVYVVVIFMTHWLLGVTAVIGCAILLVLAWLSEQRSRLPLHHADEAVAKSEDMSEAAHHNAEAITALGMLNAYRTRWQTLNAEGFGWQLLASDRIGGMSASSKAMRLLLQSLMLAIAASLAIQGALSPGAMIAATIIFGCALAPAEQIIGHWRTFIRARESCFKLENVLCYAPSQRTRSVLARPRGALEVQSLRIAAPETRTIILDGIDFKVASGQMLAIIGPSASGKSTLLRAVAGLWPPVGGAVTLDGARLDLWHAEDLGQHIGYLPQSVALFAGTVKQNIARFRDDATDEQVIEAAKHAFAHDVILGLPKGYETELGIGAASLTSGQRQRIALARALFGKPPLVVLDEPYSNLDYTGEEALSAAFDGIRQRGQTVIVVSHRAEAIGKADVLLLLESGQQSAFGLRAEVMKQFQHAKSGRPMPHRRQRATGSGAA